MTSPRPNFYVNFAATPDFFDPKIQYTRSGTASFINQRGEIAYVAANTPRWTYDPLTGECLGLIIEPAKTNSALYSEDFSNGAWTKTDCSVTANSIVALDGATTGDTIIASTTSGAVSQAVTITSGISVMFSVYAKAASSNFLQIRITDGINPVDAWFNLSSGVAGTHTSGAGSCLYLFKHIETLKNGWYRCGVGVTTTSSLSFTCSLSPTAADNTPAAANNSVYVWGAQIESSGGIEGFSSYLPTTASTVARGADVLQIPVSVAVDKWFSEKSGSMFFDWISGTPPNATSSFVIGGIGDTFANTIYISKYTTSIGSTYIKNTVATTRLLAAPVLSIGARVKAVTSWSSTRVALCANGNSTNAASVATDYVPASTVRIGVGGTPWATPVNSLAFGIFRAAAYYPYQLTDEEMRVISAL